MICARWPTISLTNSSLGAEITSPLIKSNTPNSIKSYNPQPNASISANKCSTSYASFKNLISTGNTSDALSIAKSRTSLPTKRIEFNPAILPNTVNKLLIIDSVYVADCRYFSSSMKSSKNALTLSIDTSTVMNSRNTFINAIAASPKASISASYISWVKYSKSSTVYLLVNPKLALSSIVSNAKLRTVTAQCSGAHKNKLILPRWPTISLTNSSLGAEITSPLIRSNTPNSIKSYNPQPNASISANKCSTSYASFKNLISTGNTSDALSIAKSRTSLPTKRIEFNPAILPNTVNKLLIIDSVYVADCRYFSSSMKSSKNALTLSIDTSTVMNSRNTFINAIAASPKASISASYISWVKYSKSSTVYLLVNPKLALSSIVSNAKLRTVTAQCSGAHKNKLICPRWPTISLTSSSLGAEITSPLTRSNIPNLTKSFKPQPNALISATKPSTSYAPFKNVISTGNMPAVLSIANTNRSPRMKPKECNPTSLATASKTLTKKLFAYKSEFKNAFSSINLFITAEKSSILIPSSLPRTFNTALNKVSNAEATLLISSVHISLVKYSKSSGVYLGSKPKSNVSKAKLITVDAHCSGAHKKVFKLPNLMIISLKASLS